MDSPEWQPGPYWIERSWPTAADRRYELIESTPSLADAVFLARQAQAFYRQHGVAVIHRVWEFLGTQGRPITDWS